MKTKSKNKSLTLDLENLDTDNIILLNQISSELITEFNKLPELIFDITDKKSSWFFTTIFSRNYYQMYCSFDFLIFLILFPIFLIGHRASGKAKKAKSVRVQLW